MWVLAALLLLAAMPGSACPVCRPRVEAAIHAPGYAANVALLLLPALLLLALGLGLFWLDSWWPRCTSAAGRVLRFRSA